MNEYLDKYCERIAPGLWQEPFNLISNLAFLLVAYIIYRKYLLSQHANFKPQWDIRLLVLLCVLIAIGSGLWHLFATRRYLWFDRIPIMLFINVYLISCLRRVLQVPWFGIALVFILYHIMNTSVQLWFSPLTLNGSLFYIPTLLFLMGIVALLFRQHSEMYRTYAFAAFCFTIALILRTFDLNLCSQFSIGSHFAWHILIALTLYILLKGLILGNKYQTKQQ